MRIDGSKKAEWQALVAGLEANKHPVNPERDTFEVDTGVFGSDFLRTLEGDEEFARSLRTVRHDFWLEQHGEKWQLVAPESDTLREFFNQWKAESRRVWRTIESIDTLIVESSDFTNTDQRTHLKTQLVALKEHSRIINLLAQEIRSDKRAQVAGLVGSFTAQHNNVVMPYSELLQMFDHAKYFGEIIEEMRAAPFKYLDLCRRISGSLNKSCSHSPAFSVELGDVPPEGVIPASDCLGVAHALFDRIALMGAWLASPAEKRSVELRYSCAGYEQSSTAKWATIVVDNPDGWFALHFSRLMQQPHLFPVSWCEIPKLAAQVAPAGLGMQLIGTQMHIPLRIR